MEQRTEIKFRFHPMGFENKEHTIEKAATEGGKKKRYLVGISSGIKIDQHGEKMTQSAICMMMDQFNSGCVLLYPDIHGIKASEDIGKLVEARILPNGDWYTEYLLYDEDDDVPQSKLDVIDVIWKQINGLPPYDKPIQKGFSVEGYIPSDGIIQMSEDGKRVINKVFLDGVVLVPRPAYKEGIANAVFKALDELPTWVESSFKDRVRKTLSEKIDERKKEQQYYQYRTDLQELVDKEVKEVMLNGRLSNNQKVGELNVLFDEFKKAVIPEIIKASTIFQEENNINKADRKSQLISQLSKQYDLLKSLMAKGATNE